MSNDTLVQILNHPLVSTYAVGKIMNPEKPGRVHGVIRNKNPKFTEAEIERLEADPDWKRLRELMQTEIPFKAF